MRNLTLPILLAVAATCSFAIAAPPPPITHVIMIMQENRSFDNYFGTFPGADGIPANVCLPYNLTNPQAGCIAPYHDPREGQVAGLHTASVQALVIDDGLNTFKMDGFAYAVLKNLCRLKKGPCPPAQPASPFDVDVMGYHNADELPNYWAYAQNFVLQDRMFPSARGWSPTSHDYLVSEWSAKCSNQNDAKTCVTDVSQAFPKPSTVYPWVSLFQLLDVHNVTWKYYLGEGTEPDCEDGEMTCAPEPQKSKVPSFWNPSPYFAWVRNQGGNYLALHNPPLETFLADIKAGTLPQVSWIVPASGYSEHPPSSMSQGQDYVTSLVNAVMQSPYWQNTAIFISWDEFGGFYDHVPPPDVDFNKGNPSVNGYGVRVPGLMISAYAKQGLIDHSVLSFDQYATFIEDLFAGSARLDPAALGNPDARPTIRDSLTSVTLPDGTTAPIGNLMDEFDFTQAPRPTLILSSYIPFGLQVTCGKVTGNTASCPNQQLQITWKSLSGAQVPIAFQYHVTRDSAELSQCTGTGVSCNDTPGPGVHLYRVYSVIPAGATSPISPAAYVTVAN